MVERLNSISVVKFFTARRENYGGEVFCQLLGDLVARRIVEFQGHVKIQKRFEKGSNIGTLPSCFSHCSPHVRNQNFRQFFRRCIVKETVKQRWRNLVLLKEPVFIFQGELDKQPSALNWVVLAA